MALICTNLLLSLLNVRMLDPIQPNICDGSCWFMSLSPPHHPSYTVQRANRIPVLLLIISEKGVGTSNRIFTAFKAF